MMTIVLVDRWAMSNEEEGHAKDDWEVLGFLNRVGGDSRRAALLLKAPLLLQCQTSTEGGERVLLMMFCRGNILLIKK